MKWYLVQNSRGEYAAHDGCSYVFSEDVEEALPLIFSSKKSAQQWWEKCKNDIMWGEPKSLKCSICSITFSAPVIEKELK